MMLVMLGVAWQVTSVCVHHDVRGMRDLGSGGSSEFYFPSPRDPLQPPPGGGSVAGQCNIRPSAEL